MSEEKLIEQLIELETDIPATGKWIVIVQQQSGKIYSCDEWREEESRLHIWQPKKCSSLKYSDCWDRRLKKVIMKHTRIGFKYLSVVEKKHELVYLFQGTICFNHTNGSSCHIVTLVLRKQICLGLKAWT